MLWCGRVFWRDDFAPIIGMDDVGELLETGVVPYSQLIGAFLGGDRLYTLIISTPGCYTPAMDAVLTGGQLSWLIQGRRITYSPRMDEKIGAEQLQYLIKHNHVQYEPRMAGFLGTERLLDLVEAGKIPFALGTIPETIPRGHPPPPLSHPLHTGHGLAMLVRRGTVKWRNAWAPFVGSGELYMLVRDKVVAYDAQFDTVLGGHWLSMLIHHRDVAYAPHMDAVLGAQRLCQLIMDNRVEYDPRMNALIGDDALLTLGLSVSRRDAAELIPSGYAPILYPSVPAKGDDPIIPDDDPRCCTLCYEHEARTAVIDCGHSYGCITCMSTTKPTSCAICRKPVVKGVMTIYKA